MLLFPVLSPTDDIKDAKGFSQLYQSQLSSKTTAGGQTDLACQAITGTTGIRKLCKQLIRRAKQLCNPSNGLKTVTNADATPAKTHGAFFPHEVPITMRNQHIQKIPPVTRQNCLRHC